MSITFSKAIDPATVTLQNFFVLRQGSAAAWPPTAATLSNYINLNSDPRTTISYNPTTFTVTLNYSALPQTETAHRQIRDRGLEPDEHELGRHRSGG